MLTLILLHVLLWDVILYYGFDMKDIVRDLIPAMFGLSFFSSGLNIYLISILGSIMLLREKLGASTDNQTMTITGANPDYSE